MLLKKTIRCLLYYKPKRKKKSGTDYLCGAFMYTRCRCGWMYK